MGYFRNDEDRQKKADKIIRNHIAWSMGAGLIPIPIADIFAVSAVQLDMVKQLANAYDIDFEETQGKALITSLVGTSIARVMAGTAAKLIPGFGTIVGGAAMVTFSGASTYAIGEVFREHFNTGGTFLDFDTERLKKYYSEKFEKGKEVAEQIKQEEEEKKRREEQQRKADEMAAAREKQMQKAEEMANTKNTKTEAQSSLDATLTKLKELAKMRDAGTITEGDFQQMKKKLVDNF